MITGNQAENLVEHLVSLTQEDVTEVMNAMRMIPPAQLKTAFGGMSMLIAGLNVVRMENKKKGRLL